MRRLLFAAILALAAAGCQDLRNFKGTWHGSLSQDPALAQGFAAGSTAALEITAADTLSIHGRLSLPPLFDETALVSIAGAAADALGEAKVGSSALRTYFAFATPTSGDPALLVVSLFEGERVELRVVRGTADLFGLFDLAK
jgi:hypothetical protein